MIPPEKQFSTGPGVQPTVNTAVIAVGLVFRYLGKCLLLPDNKAMLCSTVLTFFSPATMFQITLKKNKGCLGELKKICQDDNLMRLGFPFGVMKMCWN